MAKPRGARVCSEPLIYRALSSNLLSLVPTTCQYWLLKEAFTNDKNAHPWLTFNRKYASHHKGVILMLNIQKINKTRRDRFTLAYVGFYAFLWWYLEGEVNVCLLQMKLNNSDLFLTIYWKSLFSVKNLQYWTPHTLSFQMDAWLLSTNAETVYQHKSTGLSNCDAANVLHTRTGA